MVRQKPAREFIAYQGKQFTIEWYFDENGHSQALEYAEELNEADRKKSAALIMALGDLGVLRNK